MHRRICLGLAAYCAALLLWVASTGKRTDSLPPENRAGRPRQTTAERPVYRYSVVPGGIYTAQEMAAARRHDPVVASHYAGLSPRVHAVRLESGFSAHVSYRVRNAVYWTRRRVRLHAGEVMLSDGSNLIRARCGNRISTEAQEPVREEEPSAGALEEAMAAPAEITGDEDRRAESGTPGVMPGLPTPAALKPPLAPELPFGLLPGYAAGAVAGDSSAGGGGTAPPATPPLEPAGPLPENAPPYIPSAPPEPWQPNAPPGTPAPPRPLPPSGPPVLIEESPILPVNPAPAPKPIPAPASPDRPSTPTPVPGPSPGPAPGPAPLVPLYPQEWPVPPYEPLHPTPEPGAWPLLVVAALSWSVLRWRASCGK